jgi:hypothetical protein
VTFGHSDSSGVIEFREDGKVFLERDVRDRLFL